MVKAEIMPSGCNQISQNVTPSLSRFLQAKRFDVIFSKTNFIRRHILNVFRPNDFNFRQNVMFTAKIKQFLRFTAESVNFSTSCRLNRRKFRAFQQSRFAL